MAIARKYSDEIKAESVQRVLERRLAEPSDRSIVREVAADFNVGVQSLRQWVAKVDDGSFDYAGSEGGTGPSRRARGAARRDAASDDDYEALIAELLHENEVLRSAIAVLAKTPRARG